MWTREAWTSPASHHVDALETLARFQIAAEEGPFFHASPEVSRLGAPWGADWSGYPLPDGLWYALVGLAANAVGLVPASNLALLGAHLLAVLAFYLCARALGHRPAFAAAAAFAFGFSYSIFHRGLSHHSFALAFSVPPALLVAWWIGAGGRVWARRSTWGAALGVAAVVGTASPYFTFLFLQLCVLALGYQALARRRPAALRAGFLTIAVCLGAFVLAYLPYLRATSDGSTGGELARDYAGSEVYGLKPVELLVPPPTHRWAAAADLGRLYAASTSLRGEWFTSYLGLIGVASLLTAVVVNARAWLRRRGGLRPSHLPLGLWIVLFAGVGGLNGLLALAGIDHFRAGNRYSIHLLALVLFFASAWASRRTRTWSARATWLAATPFAMFALWDQAPPPPAASHRDTLRARVEADRAAGAELEAALPSGAQLFQLPATPFPEAGARGAMGDYEHLRLLLGTRDLRFSYGVLGGTSAHGLQERTAALPPADLAATLESWGFAGLLIDRRAYPDRGDALLGALAATGRNVADLKARPDLAFVRLSPATTPQPPDPALLRHRPAWSPETGTGEVTLHPLEGWYGLEREGDRAWRWAGKRAVLGLWNDTVSPRRVRLTGRVQGASPGRLRLRFDGGELASWELGREAVSLGATSLSLPAGASRLEWRFDGRLIRPDGDPRALGFSVEGLGVAAD